MGLTHSLRATGAPLGWRRTMGRLGVALLIVQAAACASPYEPQQVREMLGASVTSAGELLDRDRAIEAAQMVRAARRVDAEFPGLAELDERLLAEGAAISDLFAPTPLGSNLQRRREIERPTEQKVLLYLPDRLLDLLDIVTLEVHAGPGAYFDLHVTRALQLAGGIRAIAGLGTYGNRTILGGRGHANAGLTILPVGVQAQGGGLASLGGIRTGSQTLAGVHNPTDEYYQEYADYWEYGASFTIGYVGVTFDYHLVQIADFLAGFVLVDFLNDDLSHTTALDLSPEDQNLILDLSRAARSEETMAAYREAADAPATMSEATTSLGNGSADRSGVSIANEE